MACAQTALNQLSRLKILVPAASTGSKNHLNGKIKPFPVILKLDVEIALAKTLEEHTLMPHNVVSKE